MTTKESTPEEIVGKGTSAQKGLGVWLVVLALMMVFIGGGLVQSLMEVHRLDAVNEGRVAQNARQDSSIQRLITDGNDYRAALLRRGVDPNTIAPPPSEVVGKTPSTPPSQSSAIDYQYVTGFIANYINANKPKDGKTPTVKELDALVQKAIVACEEKCRGPKGSVGTKGDPGVGQNGAPGISIVGAIVDEASHLIFSLSDGNTINAGPVPSGPKGGDGLNGANGTNGTNGTNAPTIVGFDCSTTRPSITLTIRLSDGLSYTVVCAPTPPPTIGAP